MPELKKNNPCGDGKVIDEYLGGTICEYEKEVQEIEVSDQEYEVYVPHEPVEPDDRYEGML